MSGALASNSGLLRIDTALTPFFVTAVSS